MIAKQCLIIDNEDQKTEISLLEKISKERQFPIECHYINTTSKECQREETLSNGNPYYTLDLDLFFESIQSKFSSENIDLIATDYDLQDSITGLDIVTYLKEKKWKGKIPIVVYSGDSEEIREGLQSRIKSIIEDKDELSTFVVNFLDTHPNHIYDRGKGEEKNSYVEDIYEFLKKNKTNLNSKLYQKLRVHSDKEFKNIFPKFEGMKLDKISDLIIKNSIESDEFENEFLDRCIDHFIHLK